MPTRSFHRNARIAATLIMAAGLATASLAILADYLGVGETVASGMFGWKQVSLLVVGVLLLAVGGLLFARPQLTVRWIEWQRADYAPSYLSKRNLRYVAIGLLALLGIVLVWTRLAHIDESLWHDEAHSVLNHNGFTEAFGGHVLFNQLSWATTALFGESEAMHRFWSVVPGIAAVGFGAWWAWRRIGAVAALAFATFAVASPLHLEHMPEARGYGLAVLAATLMLIAADRLTRSYSKWTLLGFLAVGLAGIWTLIFFAFSFVGQTIALLWWPKVRRLAIAILTAGGVLTLVYYRPSPDSWGQVAGETIPLTGALLFERTLDWLVVPTATLVNVEDHPLRLIDHQFEPGWAEIAAPVLIAAALWALWRRRDAGLALLLVMPPLLFNLAFSIGDLNTVPRHQLVLLPHVLFLVAIGVAELGGLVARVRVLKPVVIAIGVAGVLVLSAAIVEREQAHGLPRENFKEVANVVRWADVQPVVTDSARATGLIYYLGDELRVLPTEAVDRLLCRHREELIYIHHRYPEPSTVDLDCLVGTGAIRIRVPQRDRGYFIDVWIVKLQADAAREPDQR